jgi:hypothetical protein
VPEDEIAEVRLGMKVELATASYPDIKLNGKVVRINPVATPGSNKNVYEVRVAMDHAEQWMKPGMEGVGKITVGEARWGWLLSHRLVKWTRMKLWW